MSHRKDIEPDPDDGWRRLSYTRRCGWVDWGHALPTAAASLIGRVRTQSDPVLPLPPERILLEGQSAFALRFGLTSGALGVKRQLAQDYVVRRNMPSTHRWSAALGIFMHASVRLEQYQGSFPLGLVSSSSFSGEDLVSNLIGFYAAARHIRLKQMREICGEVSVAESYRIWDTHLSGGLSGFKNHRFRPRLFPTKEGVHSPADLTWPQVLSTIRPSPAGSTWAIVRNQLIPQRLIDSGAVLTVKGDGSIDVQRPGTLAIPRPSR